MSTPNDTSASPQGSQFSVRDAFRPTIEAAVPFDTVNELFNDIDRSQEDVLRVHPVSRDQFQYIDDARDRKGRKFRFFYLEETKLLIVTIPSGPHEMVLSYIGIQMTLRLDRMSLLWELEAHRAQRYTYQGGGGLSGSGEGDESYQPRSTRPEKDSWPTLVVEVSCSLSLQEMRAKAQVWFRRSAFDINIVLLVKLAQQDRSMTIEKWKVPGPGSLEPRCVHTTKVESPGADRLTNLQAYTVTGGDLRGEFTDLFLRDPGPDEGDIVIGPEHLRYAAMRGFDLMG